MLGVITKISICLSDTPWPCDLWVNNLALWASFVHSCCVFYAEPEGHGGVAIVVKKYVMSLSQRPNETFTVCQCRSFNQISIY